MKKVIPFLILLLFPSALMSYCCPFVKGVIGEGIGFRKGYGTAGLFVSAFNGCAVQPFVDVRAHFLRDHRRAFNGGLGCRFLSTGPCPSLFGMNVYYDFTERCIGDFQQVGLGFEYYVGNIEVRANTYFPVQRARDGAVEVFDHYAGDYVVKCQKRELSVTGFDTEFLANLFCRGCTYLYLGAGPYYYYDYANQNFGGGRARFGFQIAQFLAIEGVGSYDTLFKGRIAGRIVLSFPLGCIFPQRRECSPNVLSRVCTGCGPFVFRNEIIPTRKGCCWSFNYDDN